MSIALGTEQLNSMYNIHIDVDHFSNILLPKDTNNIAITPNVETVLQ